MNQCINLDLYGKHKHKGKENTITVKVENAMTVTIILMAATTNEHCPILYANWLTNPWLPINSFISYVCVDMQFVKLVVS